MARGDSGLMVLLLILGFGLIWWTLQKKSGAATTPGTTPAGGDGESCVGCGTSPSLDNLMRDLSQDIGRVVAGFSEVVMGQPQQPAASSQGGYTGPTSPYDVSLADIFWPKPGVTPTAEQIASGPEGKAYGPYLELWWPETVRETERTTGRVPQGPI